MLSLGLPISLSTILGSVSGAVANNLLMGLEEGSVAVAGQSVASRIGQMISMTVMGICMGMQPAISFKYSAGNMKRLTEILKKTTGLAVITGTVLSALCLVFRDQLLNAFLDNSNVLEITMPAPVVGGAERPRAMVDVTIPKGLKLGTLRADYQLNQPKADVHSGFYKGKNKFASYDVLYDCILPTDTNWTTAFAPSMMMVNEDGVIKEGEHDIIRFSIWFANYTSPIVLKVDNIGYFEDDAKWYTKYIEDKVE